MKNHYLSLLFFLIVSVPVFAQVKISAMPETKEDPAGGWIPVVLSNKNYKYNPGSYVQQRTIENIRGLSPTNLPANYVYYVTDLGKQGIFQYDNADVTSVDDGATVLVTKNNLRFKRIIENNTVNAKWFEMGSDPAAVINTLKYRNNAVITYDQAQAIFNRVSDSRVTLQDADFTTQTATWFALQRAINFCLASGNKLYIPAGEYDISKGLLVAPPPGVYTTSFEIGGAVTPYDPDKTNQTMLKFSNKDNFGIGFHRVKGVRVRNLFVKGQNQITGTLYDYFENPDMDWTHGCRNHNMSPHAGFVVDPLFNQGTGAEVDMYPGFQTFYTDGAYDGGSTDVIFENCRVERFIVGYCFSPHSFPQNGDNIAVNNSWVNYCKSGIAIGQSQNRSIAVNNLKCWGGVETLFDSQQYGDGYSADNVEVDGLQIAGGVKFLARMTGWANKGLQITRMHAELLLSLGVSGGTPLVIENSFVDLSGTLPESGIHSAISAFQGDLLSIKNSYIAQYQSSSMPVIVHCNGVRLENSKSGVINLGNNNPVIINDTKIRYNGRNASEISGGFPFSEGDEVQPGRYFPDGVTTPKSYKRIGMRNQTLIWIENSIRLIDIDPAAMEASFVLPIGSPDFNKISIGAVLLAGSTKPNSEFGQNVNFAFGKVKSKNASTGKIELMQTAKCIDGNSNYTCFYVQDYNIIPSFILGTATQGSEVVTNIGHESIYWPEYFSGYIIQSPYFPTGTYIVSGDPVAKTLTMSQKALTSQKGMEIISADWNAVEYGPGPAPAPAGGYGYNAYKKGDVIYNTDETFAPSIEKWLCVKSGLLDAGNTSPYPPEFTIHFNNVNRTLTSNGTIDISGGRFISSIIVKPTVALSGFKIGTTPGGSNILATTSVAANAERVFNLNRYFKTKTTLYVSGITGSVEIIIPK